MTLLARSSVSRARVPNRWTSTSSTPGSSPSVARNRTPKGWVFRDPRVHKHSARLKSTPRKVTTSHWHEIFDLSMVDPAARYEGMRG